MTAHTPTADTPYDDLPARHVTRRSREELEALAADFVNSKLHPLPPAPRKPLPRAVLAGLAGGAFTALAGLGAWTLWPSAEITAPPASAPAIDAQWAQRLEAERERKRQELERSRQYLAKMAAADSALVQDMSNRAQGLASRADRAAPPVRADEPTPKLAATTSAATASPPAPVPAPAEARTGAPAKAASQAEPATPAPATVAAAPRCNIHVSELSSSGKLTYADVARMKGVRVASDGHAFTPPLKTAEGRSVVFEVMPSGCVRVARGSR